MASELPPALQARIDAIRADRVHGAVFLATETAETLAAAADLGVSVGFLQHAAEAIRDAQPAMAPLANLADLVRANTDAARLAESCREFAARLRDAGRRIAELASGLITDGATVLTHSASGTVRDALLAAHGAGTAFRVIVTESRPMLEGAALAEELKRQGIPTTVIGDEEMERIVGEADIVLVGADSVCPDGLVNKKGTAALALVARACRKPIYALCSTAKFRGETPGELPPDFDSTPLGHLTDFVTEDGIAAPARRQDAVK